MKECIICKKELVKKQKKCCSKECRNIFFSHLNNGRVLSEEHKDKLSKAGKGRKFTDEHKKNLSNSLKQSITEEVKEKRKQTCLERFGVEHAAQSEEIQDKMKQTCLERFGVEHAAQSEEIQDKMKQTCLERFGYESNLSSFDHRLLTKEILLERYGVEHALQSEVFKNKMKQTCLERFGVEHAAQSEEIQDKMKQTCLERFGVDNIQKKHLINDLPYLTSQDWWNSHSSFIDAKNQLKDILSLSQIYLYAHQYRPDWDFRSSISSPHQKVLDLLNEYEIKHEINTRSIISPLELDIWIPEHQLAIEVNGVYWHSELAGSKDKNYHLNKTLECEKQGIQLLQFLDIEVEQKWDIVSSMILYKLTNKSIRKIPGRKCFVRDFSSKDSQVFMDSNHLQGFRNGTIYRGLIYENELVGLLIAGVPRYSKNYDLEIIRFSTSLKTQIQGGFSKLIQSLGQNKTLVSYADRRHSQGKVYESSGWTFSHHSAPSYYYTNDYQHLYHRSAFQKHKLPKLLESFNPSLTEWENMKLNGYDRIWDCGTKTYFNK